MASYDYRILFPKTAAHTENGSRAAIEFTRTTLAKGFAVSALIERRKVGTVGRSGLNHPWLAHRAYIVDPGGIVRRTERSGCSRDRPAPGGAGRSPLDGE